MNSTEILELKKLACKARMGAITGTHNAKSGHPDNRDGWHETGEHRADRDRADRKAEAGNAGGRLSGADGIH